MKKISLIVLVLFTPSCAGEEEVSWHESPIEAALDYHLSKCPETAEYQHVLLSAELGLMGSPEALDNLGIQFVNNDEDVAGETQTVFINTPYPPEMGWYGGVTFKHSGSFVTCPGSVSVRRVEELGWTISIPEILWQSDCDFSDS